MSSSLKLFLRVLSDEYRRKLGLRQIEQQFGRESGEVERTGL